MEYREVVFKLKSFDPYGQILIAQLAEIGFDSFQEDPPFLKAYIEHDKFSIDLLEELSPFKEQFELISNETMEKINWNEEWEKNFNPLAVEDFCYIRAPFHQPSNSQKFELVIEPKMSFGTGHHATTQNMILLMRDLELKDKSVLDLGSGTGILAILASKMGAMEVYATDIEDWAYENMQENFQRNHTPQNKALLGALPLAALKGKSFDVVLANINKNVLIQELPQYKELIKGQGTLLLSGFYRDDETELSGYCRELGLEKQKEVEKDQWMAVSYQLT